MLGSQISMVVPLSFFITNSPECSLIILLTIGSPKPVPFFGSKIRCHHFFGI